MSGDHSPASEGRPKPQSSNALAALTEHIKAGVVEENEVRLVTHVNDHFRHIFDLVGSVDELIGQPSKSLFRAVAGAVQQELSLEDVANRLVTAGEALTGQEMRLENGKTVELDYVPVYHERYLTGHLWVFRDVTEKKKVEEQLRFQASVLAQVSDAIITVGPDMSIRYWNKGAETLTGCDADMALGRGPEELLSFRFPDPQEEARAWRELSENGTWAGEFVIKTPGRRSEQYVAASASVLREDDGSFGGILMVVRDVTERREMEDRLIHHAYHDTLTGLPNRMMFLRTLDSLTSAAEPRISTYAVLFLDLDRFKLVNDSLGHHAGDTMLKILAYRLKKCVDSKDLIARLGGDEFAVLLRDCAGLEDAKSVADNILEALRVPFAIDGMEVFSAASIGIVIADAHYDLSEDVLRDADTAMYEAKRAGRSCYIIFDQTLQMHASAVFQLETDLHRAIRQGDLEVYYQPVVHLETGVLAGFEALVRWIHHDRGIVSPADFVPIAEESGLIIQIDEWVMRRAALQMKAWETKFGEDLGLKLNVNCADRTFHQADLTGFIEAILSSTGLASDRLAIEITERVLIEDAENAALELSKLKKRNIKVCLDDFGTGYASLSILHKLPIDTIKIDRSFVKRMDRQEDGRKMVETVIDLGHNLGMVAVAEGIETARQVRLLQEMHCEYGQGYYFSRPVGSAEATRLIQNRSQWSGLVGRVPDMSEHTASLS